MIIVSLTLRNGAQRGKRIMVDGNHYLIGRHGDCELRLGGENISRRHCQIERNPDGVWIQDLNSRNGTLLNGRKLNRNEPFRLHHHDKIQIGDWKFRISIRDAKTREPVVFDEPPQQIRHAQGGHAESDVEKQLSELTQDMTLELDSLAEELGLNLEQEPLREEPSAGQSEQKAEVPDTSDTLSANTTSATTSLEPDETSTGPAGDSSLGNSEKTKRDSDVEKKNQEVEEEKRTGPQPIPKHLRPKGPVDSRDAAQQALKKYFGNR